MSREQLTAERGFRVRPIKRQPTHLIWEKFHRARIYKLFLVFKKWLNENVDDESRTPMCANVNNDDYSLWVYKTNAYDNKGGNQRQRIKF